MTVVQVNNPGDFYMQFPTYVTEVNPVITQLPKDMPTKASWAVGDSCLATFQGARWYRGEIVSNRGDRIYEVRYIDFGNVGVVAMQDLALVPKELERCPPQAVRAGLAGVAPVGGAEWEMQSSMYFSNLVLDNAVTVTVEVCLCLCVFVCVHVCVFVYCIQVRV